MWWWGSVWHSHLELRSKVRWGLMGLQRLMSQALGASYATITDHDHGRVHQPVTEKVAMFGNPEVTPWWAPALPLRAVGHRRRDAERRGQRWSRVRVRWSRTRWPTSSRRRV